MPQFPYDLRSTNASESAQPIDESLIDHDSSVGAANVSQSKTDEPDKKSPTKFKTVEPKGPVTRVKVDRKSRSKKSTKSPFKDLGILEDTDSLVQFRDDFGKPLVLLVLVAGIAGLIYWTYSGSASSNTESNNAAAALILEAKELEQQNPTTIQAKLELFDQKLALAEKLIATDQQAATNTGASLKLKTLTHRNTININNNIADQTVIDNLETASRNFINSRDKSIANQAKIGLTLIRIHKYLKKPEIKFFPELLDQFKLVSKFAAEEDLSSAQNLFQVAKTFESRGLASESAQLFRALNLSFSASNNHEIVAVGQDARKRLAVSSTLFEDLGSLIKTGENVPLQSIRSLVSESIRSESVTSVNLESILDFIDVLIQRDSIEETKTLLEDISGSIYEVPEGIEREAIINRFDETKMRVQQHGETFSFDGLFSVEGRPISQASLERRAKMLVYWSPDNDKSVALIEQISDNYKKFEQRKIQVIAITSISDNKEDSDRVVSRSNETRGIDFLTVLKENSKSQGFVSRFPVPKLPYWVLLDVNDRVRGINVPPGIIKVPN